MEKWLMVDERIALEKLRELSGQDWFEIRTPSYFWDAENKKRLNFIDGLKEFLSCSEGHIKELSDYDQDVIKTLWDNINTVYFDFEGV